MVTEALASEILDALDAAPGIFLGLPELAAEVAATPAELAAHLVHLADLGALLPDRGDANSLRLLPENDRVRITGRGRAMQFLLEDTDPAVRAKALVGIGLS